MVVITETARARTNIAILNADVTFRAVEGVEVIFTDPADGSKATFCLSEETATETIRALNLALRGFRNSVDRGDSHNDS